MHLRSCFSGTSVRSQVVSLGDKLRPTPLRRVPVKGQRSTLPATKIVRSLTLEERVAREREANAWLRPTQSPLRA